MLPLPPDRPLIVARRGARAHAPENTLPAFELAIAHGADAIEMDVQFTSDGELILMHGLTVDEVSDGSGRIRSHTLQEIKALDVGSWFAAGFKGLRVPTLSEALDVLAGRTILVLELKSFTRRSEGMEQMVWAEIERRGLADRTTVTSFNPFLLRRLKKLAPELRTGLMLAAGMRPWYTGGWLRRWSLADDLHVEFDLARDRFAALARKRGQPLWVLPLKTPGQVSMARSWQAAGLIADDPRWLRSLLEDQAS